MKICTYKGKYTIVILSKGGRYLCDGFIKIRQWGVCNFNLEKVH